MAKLKITRVRGDVGRTQLQRTTIRHLGLKRINSSVVREDSSELRGMLRQVGHMVNIESVE